MFFLLLFGINTSSSAVDIQGGTTLYLDGGGSSLWNGGGAWFVACFFQGTANSAVTMSVSPSNPNQYFVIAPPGTWSNVIFVRMNASCSTFSWGSCVYSQTEDLVYDGTNQLFTISGFGTSKSIGSWSSYTVSDALLSDYYTVLPVCSNNGGLTFTPNLTSSQVAIHGPNYYCKGNSGEETNFEYAMKYPTFYYIKISKAGTLIFDVTINDPAADVDYVVWGPYDSPNVKLSELTKDKIDMRDLDSNPGVDGYYKCYTCSFSNKYTEKAILENTQVGKYYIIAISNFSQSHLPISITTNPTSTGESDCTIVSECDITKITVNNPNVNNISNTYSISGTVHFSNAPTTGTLSIKDDVSGVQQVFNAPFTNPVNFSLTGISADGLTHTLTASFSAKTCSLSSTYTAPLSGDPCVINTINPSFELPIGADFLVDQSTVPGWKTTAFDGIMEFWRTGNGTSEPYDGSAFIELNANVVAGVYQDYATPDPVIFNFSFAHRGRQGTDVCKVSAGPAEGPYVQLMTASDDNTAWGLHTGSYTVPAGQTNTRFLFESVSFTGGDPRIGNFLDAITFTASTAPPTVPAAAVRYCVGDTPASISTLVTGTNLKWYPTATGGTGSSIAPVISTAASGTTLTYVTQTSANGCESSRALVTTIVNPLPTATISGTTTVCINSPQPLVTFTGLNGTPPYTFYYKIDGGVQQSITTTSGNTVTLAVPTTVGSVFKYNLISVSDASAHPCSQTITGQSATVAVTASITPIFSAIGPFCLNSTASSLPLSSNNTTPITGTWNPATISTSALGATEYTFTPAAGQCAASTKMTINIANTTYPVLTLNPVTNPNVGDNVAYAVQTGGTVYLWSLPGVLNTDYQIVSGGTTQNNITVKWLTPGVKNISVKVGNTGDCFNGSATGSTTVMSVPSPVPTVTSPVTYCQNDVAIPLAAVGTNLKWYTVSTGGVGSPSAPTPSTTTAGSSTYYVTQTVTGYTESSRVLLTVIVNPLPNATISGTTTVCINSTAPSVTFTGSNGTAPYKFYYKLNGGAQQSISTTSGNSVTLTVPTSTAGTFKYDLISVDDALCSQTIIGQSATVTVTATTVPTLTAMPATNPNVFDNVAYSTQTGATSYLWSIPGVLNTDYQIVSGGTIQDHITVKWLTSGVKNVSVALGTTGDCLYGTPNINTSVQSVQSPIPTVTPVTYCQNDVAVPLTAVGANLKWYTVATGGVGSSTAPTPGTATTGSTTYYVTQTVAGYTESLRQSIVVTVKKITTSSTTASICQGDSYSFNGTNYTTAGTYTVHLTNSVGCDSTATLVLSLKSKTTSTTTASICQGDSYAFNGTSYTVAGTYTAHLTNSVGCDSTATLVLSLKPKTTSTTTILICDGDSYSFNGTNYTTVGTYIKHLTNSVGCDSTATLILRLIPKTSSTTTAAICLGDSYTFNGSTYSTAGTYIKHLTNVAGCDSTATLVLNINQPTTSTTSVSICQGTSYTFNGSIYTNAGTYSAHLLNSAGCDSTATLVLSVKQPTVSTTTESICSGNRYLFNGRYYAVAGTYTVHLLNSVGCDSTATLVLKVKSKTTSITQASICLDDSIIFNGTSYNTAGTYASHLTNAAGCDSTATLILSIKQPTTFTTSAAICLGDNYTFNGNSYTTAGTYIHHLTNSVGCDSTATLVLTIKQPTASTTTDSICQGDIYSFNGTSYTVAGSYSATLTNSVGCDSIATLLLKVNPIYTETQTVNLILGDHYTINGHTYNQSGIYTDVFKTIDGCDSTLVTNLSVIDIPNTFTPNDDGVNDVFMKDWHIEIYNRNGILLYEGTDGWDGKYKGGFVIKDTYFYVLYLSKSKKNPKTGYLTVIQ